MGPDKICVEVVYAGVRPCPREVRVEADATVLDAISASALLQDHPELDLARNRVGIYGRFVTLSDRVRAHDRVEIYVPLPEDPKDARRLRARVTRKLSRKYGAG